MDPLSIAGFVLAIGQSIGPIVNGIRALRKFNEIEHDVAAALNQSDMFCVKIQLWLEIIGNIEETSISPTQTELLRRMLRGLQVAAESHEVEVRKWLQSLGLSDTLQGAARESERALVKRDSGSGSESSNTSRTIVESCMYCFFTSAYPYIHLINDIFQFAEAKFCCGWPSSPVWCYARRDQPLKRWRKRRRWYAIYFEFIAA